MGNNSTFDKKFQQKMENFEPAYEEQAWEKFAPQLAPTKAPFLAQGKIKALLYSIAAVAVLGIIFYMYPKKDTPIFPQNTENKDEITNTLPTEKPVFQPKKETSISPKNAENKSEITNILPTEKPVFSPQKEDIHIENKAIVSPQKGNIAENKPVFRPEKGISMPENSPNQAPFSAENNKKEPVFSEKNITNVEKNNLPKDSVGNVLMVSDSPQKMVIDSIQYKTAAWKITDRNITAPALNQPKMPSNKRDLQVSLGINTAFEEEKVATGMLVNATFRQRWGLNVGVNFAKQTTESFKDADDFEQVNGVDFRTIVPSSTPANALFSQINRQQSKWELPVSVQYHYPIYKNISVVGQLGTNILLRAKQHFSYNVETQGQPEEKEEVHHNDMPHSFQKRNMPTLGLGLQANWLRWQVQAMTYIAGNQQNMHRRHDESHFPLGIQMRLNYTLFRSKPLY